MDATSLPSFPAAPTCAPALGSRIGHSPAFGATPPGAATADARGPGAPPTDVTALIVAADAGDRAALDALLPAIYAELHRQAALAMRREAAGHTLGATALVHEAYLRLAAQAGGAGQSRTQFLAAAAHLMRQILVDHARARQAAKRGGGAVCVTLDDRANVAAPDATADVLALHEALDRLAAFDPSQARLVELRYFGGLTLEETAAALGVSPATVKREWAVARAWLRRELRA